MKLTRSWTVFFVVFAATVIAAQSNVARRSVVLELSLPNGGAPQIRIADGGIGSVEMPNIGKFGFVPTVSSESVVFVDVFDLQATPHERLDRVELVAGGDSVESDSNPPFGIRVVKVVTTP